MRDLKSAAASERELSVGPNEAAKESSIQGVIGRFFDALHGSRRSAAPASDRAERDRSSMPLPLIPF
jgi:hypothetical protein